MPEDNNETSPQLETIQHLYSITQNILSYRPQSKAFFDFNRVYGARKIAELRAAGKPVAEEHSKEYFTKALNPLPVKDIPDNLFARMSSEYGDGVYKIGIIDQNLKRWLDTAAPEEHILATGGACAMESVDVRNIRTLRAQPNGDELAKEYVKRAYAVFPSWTHITGAIAPTKGVNVLYDETFPWHLKIAEYGLEKAESRTEAVYKKFHAAVERYVNLANQEAVLQIGRAHV